MIGLLLREALDRLCVRLNMYIVIIIICYAQGSKIEHGYNKTMS